MDIKTFIIAEAGVNHNGKVELAQKMIDVAADAGVDAVKFQTFKAERVISRYAPKAKYQNESSCKNESQLEMARKFELDIIAHKKLISYCKKKHIQFLSSPFDLDSIDLLDSIGLDIFKIPSGEITNLPYLQKVGLLKKKVILSTGMADLGEIEEALDILENAGTQRTKITVLHCNTEYPTPMQDVNLCAMQTIQRAFPGIRTGYSDHTQGIEVPIAAVAMGATIIEKHFTLDKSLEGPDHKASLEPDELKKMVQSIRNIETALGSGLKKPSPSEQKNIPIVRKSIVAARLIEKGEQFTEENITVKRPGNGISPMKWYETIGQKASKKYEIDDLI